MSKKNLALLLISLLIIGLLAGCGGGQQNGNDAAPSGNQDKGGTITIKVGHVLAPTHPYTLGLQKFAELVDEKTDGKIKVEVFHSSQLGNERDMVEALQLGTQEMTLVSTAPLASFTKQFLVFDLPFVFKDTESARKVLDSELGQGLLNSLESQGIMGLCYFENGFRHVTNSKHPINKPEDLKGIKIRTMENPIHMATFKVMGADPTPMAFGELFTALQQKTIDAQENPLPIIETSKFYEVQEYLSLTGHFYAPAPLLISKSFFEGLAPELQAALKEAAIEARDYERGLLDDMNAKLVEELKEKGMKVNEPDKTLFVEAVQSVYKQFESDITPELIQKVVDAQK
ncbi:TRAP dicarboxylate transporter, DctP subunit [Tepidanaerobacter acetatoxydans Re1]|uniref:TRAP dicarboxylate transporter, DctP subunit n=1 Tax=Tepidanaerobacter acetatoxydans (strain DSM 21804 / JCM 16047 / Re1) TaxID=1209989 RepID=F4LS80_TEPAE|nr:TRAP transporter substrate-binding protein [Tepidanaerobacter acetatoxydans]AEE90343.1 TRAP dicarboxylate transporter, DctP subunit [Tepidanaerobacter acetatoxydans Re1]CCP24833.1 TRAP dicarboxylate transporter, DctP subunit [Tepidanaerobacter acetatoxydans Re1]